VLIDLQCTVRATLISKMSPCKPSIRGITLLNVAYKIFTNILYGRIQPYTEKVLQSYQCGFRPGKSTVNQIYTIRQMMERMMEYDVETYHLFVDFKTAYDYIIRKKLYEAMQELGFPKN